ASFGLGEVLEHTLWCQENQYTLSVKLTRPISWSGLRPTDEVCTPLTASSRREPLSYISQKWKRACALL
ncbi:unnamed protein product, partial [Durusdinium trenchii]